MKKRNVLILFVALVLSLSVVMILNTFAFRTEESANSFDWDLPTAVSAGIESDHLASLTDDEIRVLHQPYIDIADAISLEFGVNITIGTIDCYEITRDDILYAISNISLAEHDSRLRELGESVRNSMYVSRVLEIAIAYGGYGVRELIDSFNYGTLDPVEAYYRIQQDGIISFIEEIGYIP